MKYIPGGGSIGAKLVILTDSPTAKDTESGRLLNNRDFDDVLMDAGIQRGSCWITSVSKYHVPPSPTSRKIPFHVRAKQAGINLDEQIKDLRNELNSIKPNCILALTAGSLWALYGKDNIGNYRGSILYSGLGCKFVPSYNPVHLGWQATDIEFKGYYNRALMVLDFKRAKFQSGFPEYKIPQRRLEIARSSYDLYRFLQEYPIDKFPDVAADIEAGGSCLPICMGLSFDKRHGMCIPLWNIDNISSMSESELVQVWRMIAEVLYERGIIGQNFNYDRDKIRRLGFRVRLLISDIMLKGFAINPELPKSLASNQSIFTEEPFYKDEGMYQGKLEDLFIGCARDACVTKEIDEAMEPDLIELNQRDFYYNFLMTLPEMYLEIENNGFGIDTDERDRLLRRYVAWDERLRYELYQLVGTTINVNSPKQVYDLLFNTLKCPRRNGTGEEELTSLLNLQSFNDPTKRRIVELILEDRRVRKSISTYLMALPDYDGRMKTTCFPCLETGRSSTGQQEPPIRPLVEVIDENGKKKKKAMGIAFQTMTKHGDIGQDIRGQYIPFENLI